MEAQRLVTNGGSPALLAEVTDGYRWLHNAAGMLDGPRLDCINNTTITTVVNV